MASSSNNGRYGANNFQRLPVAVVMEIYTRKYWFVVRETDPAWRVAAAVGTAFIGQTTGGTAKTMESEI